MWLGSCVAVAMVWASSHASDSIYSLGTSVYHGYIYTSYTAMYHIPLKKQGKKRKGIVENRMKLHTHGVHTHTCTSPPPTLQCSNVLDPFLLA